MKGMFEKSAIGNMIFVFGPFVLAPVISLLFLPLLAFVESNFRSFNVFTCGVLLIGFGLFSYSKIINFKKGSWISFGTRNMNKNQKILYFSGYGLMLFGVLCTAAIVSSIQLIQILRF